MPSLSLHRGLAVALLALISAQVLAQSAAAPGTFKLTPRVGVDLQPVAVHIPAQFDHLPDTLSVNLPPGFSASVFAATIMPLLPILVPPAAIACQECADVPGTQVAVVSPAVGTTQLTSATSVEPPPSENTSWCQIPGRSP